MSALSARGAAAASAPVDPVARWRPYVAEASRRFGVPSDWIERVIRAESGGRTTLGGRPITSPAGAMGLMQLMPATWAALRDAYGFGRDPHDPRANILAGTAYLARLYRRFGYPGLFGAYNAGPARYAAWLAGRASLPAETRAYLARLGAAPSPAALFAPGSSARSAENAALAPTASVGTGASADRSRPAASAELDRLFVVDRDRETGAAGATDGLERGLFAVPAGGASRAAED